MRRSPPIAAIGLACVIVLRRRDDRVLAQLRGAGDVDWALFGGAWWTVTEPLKYVVRIRRNSDGHIASYNDSIPKEYAPNKEDGFFIWEEGNYACDCNRYSFFCRAVGNDEAKDDDAVEHLCGHTRYAVLDITFEDGLIFYPDGKDP